MENNLTPGGIASSITFDDLCIQQLKSTRKWTKFLSLLGFIFIAFVIIVLGLFFMQFSGTEMASVATVLPLVLLSLVYFFPIYYLWKFSIYSKVAIQNNDSESLGKAMKFLKRHYIFIGILVILILVCYLIAGIGVFLFGALDTPFKEMPFF